MEESQGVKPSLALPERTRGFFSGSRKLYVAAALLAMAIGYFGFTVFQNATVYYLTVDELLALDTKATETVRVAGKLVPDSFQRDPQGTMARFTLTDGKGVLAAQYDGILPELFFNEQSQIVLEGRYDGSGVFHTSSVVVKCPSKYQAVESGQTTPA
ncbi:MAG: cytochrome c maturation protein CcmE [Chloroflexi bacterium]|nr:cytochrome c maturation protein CcmE [Chloroflexota bacterium]